MVNIKYITLYNKIILSVNTFNAFITTFNFATQEAPLSYKDFKAELLNHEILFANQATTTSSNTNGFLLYSNKTNNGDYKPKLNVPPKTNGPSKPHSPFQRQNHNT